ncbi:MAG: carboxymuconolactone decarboxylase family protein [Gammaproteobacteria bacterium]|nr:carboxymuconolactone decarboxylase family protein [Gammaproteobacteria bacterium]MBU1776302.1 carboxymuconolactone decarboxylase family protein [Gammaproteobacteria bacterium]MBU1969393.1 carboxymuconolactone decarboxylase family protein [Gammaproteobacteria bacterium]
MNPFKLHNLATAPVEATPILHAAEKGLGFIPNLYAHLAEAPVALEAYKDLGALLEKSTLSPTEQQVVLIAVSVKNNCAYCVAAHSFLARNMVKVPDNILAALRSGQPLPDVKLNALATFTKAVVRERGWVSGSQELNDFFSAGYTQRNALEVVLGVTMKTLSNYANHLTDTPLDVAFASEAWEISEDSGCCQKAA